MRVEATQPSTYNVADGGLSQKIFFHSLASRMRSDCDLCQCVRCVTCPHNTVHSHRSLPAPPVAALVLRVCALPGWGRALGPHSARSRACTFINTLETCNLKGLTTALSGGGARTRLEVYK